MLIATALVAASGRAVAAGNSGVHGRVLGHAESGEYLGVVAQATVSFADSAGKPVAETTTDKNGYYLVDLPAGEYRYQLKAAGYRSDESGRGIRLTQSQGYAIFNFSMTKGVDDPTRTPPKIPTRQLGTLQGRVVEKGVTPVTGIAHARIVLRRSDSTEFRILESRGSSDGSQATGDYKVELEAGSYTASINAVDFEQLIELEPIIVKANTTSQREFALVRKPLEVVSGQQGIRGTVTIVDSSLPTPPVRVEIASLDNAKPMPLAVQVATNGSFTQRLPAGTYRVTASADGFPNSASPPVFVLADRYSLINLTLRARLVPAPKTSLEVFVFARIKDQTEVLPLAGARVSLTKAKADTHAALESITDATGHALIPVPDAGTYTATAFLDGYTSGTASGSVLLGQTHEVGIELNKQTTTPPSNITLRVSVLDVTTKRPIAGAKLLARHSGETLAESVRGVTDIHGSAALTLKRAGSFTVLAQTTGYKPGGSSFDVTIEGTNTLTLTLEPIASPNVDRPGPRKPDDTPRPPHDPPIAKPHLVEGYVAYRELSGQLRSVPNAKLFWQRIDPSNPPVSAFATTASNGHYQVDVHVGQYQVRVEPPAGFKQVLEQVAISATTHEKYFIIERTERGTIQSDPLQRVSGTVVAEGLPGRFVPVAGAEVVCTHGQTFEKSVTDNQGAFVMRMAPERYQVTIRARGYETLDSPLVVQAGLSPLRYVLKRSTLVPSDHLLTIAVIEQDAKPVGAMRVVANAKIQIVMGGQTLTSGVTDMRGQLSTRLRTGSYTVRVEKAGFSPSTKSITIAQSDVVERIVLRPNAVQPDDPIGQLVLKVQVFQRDARPATNIRPISTPLVGAQVIVMLGAKRVAIGRTGPNGVYTTPLNAGSYSVKVESAGFAPAGKSITLSQRETQLDFQLNKLHSDPANLNIPDKLRRGPILIPPRGN
ncbi:MAG: carboxypeptidase regulatory-like domain-containing protein [Pirellulaceae bacterium]|nr:carboxypeptidase regulatory-like domain-containing protein [Pirellulaceae bacterium]